MIWSAWRGVRTLFPERRRTVVAMLVAEAFGAGALEGLVLVLVVAAGAAAIDDGVVSFDLLAGVRLEGDLAPVLGLAAVAGASVLALHAHVAHLTARTSATVLMKARDRAVDAFASTSWTSLARTGESTLQQMLVRHASQVADVVVFLSAFCSSVLALAALLALALLFDPPTTAAAVLLGALLLAALRPLSRQARERARRHLATEAAFAEQAAAWGRTAMDLRVFGVVGASAASLHDASRRAAESFERSRRLSRFGGELYRDVAILLLVGVVGILEVAPDANPATIGAIVLLVVRCLSYAPRALTALHQIGEIEPNIAALTSQLEALGLDREQTGCETISEITGVSLVDVGYDYEAGRRGIDGLTLHMRAGETIGVIGPSGAGKSTLIHLLLRLRRPARGSITVSGLRYEEIDSSSWSRLVAVVPQEPTFFEGTILENIAFYRSDVTRADVQEALLLAHVLDDVDDLPAGLDTVLGPRGSGLSVGQQQRLAIARALAGKPQLLVLDEPTSALDVRSERLLVRTIEDLKGRVLTVVVAHRLTTLVCCDRVVSLEEGRVKLVGSLDEALESLSFDPAALARLGLRAANGDSAHLREVVPGDRPRHQPVAPEQDRR